MKKAIQELYKSFVPLPLREKITMYRDASGFDTLRRNIIAYYSALPDITPEQKQVIEYLKKHPLAIFPYDFTAKYSAYSIEVIYDPQKQLHYVLHDGKKLYFKRSWSKKHIRDYYITLLIEQDAQSPHRYLTPGFNITMGDVVADVGAAEGNFALSVVENAKYVYLFETESSWIEALEATFEPWSHKIKIINSFVSDTDGKGIVSIDTFFAEHGHIDFLKIDIEGAEEKLLQGAKTILSSSSPLKLAICTYHNQNDEENFTSILEKTKFRVTSSAGYIIYFYDKLSPPYLRRGLLRAVR